MKKLCYLLVSTLFVMVLAANGNIALAQPPGPPSPEEMAQRENEWMKTELNLNADQQKKVEAINLKYAKEMQQIFQNNRGDFSSIRPKMDEMQAKKRTELQPVLTEDQLKKYDAVLAERRANRPGPPM
jgi:Spy/CpxP family protein refolding chaperone